MSKSEGQVLDFEKICRLCLLEKRSMSAIFSKKKSDKKVPLPVRIMSCASLELYEGDGLPASICSKCLLSVNQSYAFKEQCEQADTTLRQYAQRMNETTEDASTKTKANEKARRNPEVKCQQNIREITLKKVIFNEGSSVSVIASDNFRKEMSKSKTNQVPVNALGCSNDFCTRPRKSVKCDDTNLFDKLLKNKDIVVKKKELKEHLVTDEEEKWLIIRTLSQRTLVPDVDMKTKNQTESIERTQTILKCLESMIKRPAKNDSLVFCKECNLFMKSSSLRGHNKFVHEQLRKYLCQVCGYAAHTGSILRQHVQAVHVGYIYGCQKCPKKFNLLKRLRKHEDREHSSVPKVPEKKKICHFCGVAFARLSYLKVHLLTHTGESPLQCQYCSRRFKFRWALKQHERLHTGVKPYKCSYCEEAFTQNSVRKTHERKCHATANEREENGVAEEFYEDDGDGDVGDDYDNCGDMDVENR